MKQCSECNRQYADADIFCPFDGQELFVMTRTPDVIARATPDAMTRAQAAQAQPVPDNYDYLLGTTLDRRYKIERRLGEGGMGVVFLARHVVIEKAVAIKVLKHAAARDQNVVRRFVQEAKAASRIGHPNIVDVTDFGSTPDGTTYSVMEYVDGQTLAEVIHTEARLYPSRAVQIVLQIARALAKAHAKGIVHRDLKPENIFLVQGGGRTDFVKIVDFGIAKVTSIKKDPTLSPRLTRQGMVFGTPEYMPPEQASGNADLDRRVDIYSLGIILYHMLVGRVPHKGDSIMNTLTMVINDPIIPPSQAAPELGISDAFETVVMRAVEKQRERRYQSMEELIVGLEAAAGDVASNVPRAVTPPPAAVEPPVAGPGEATLSPDQPDLRQAQDERSDAKTVKEPDGVTPPRPGDPAFLGGGRTLRRFDDPLGETMPPSELRPSKLPAVLAAVLVIGALGVGAALLMRAGGKRRTGATPARDAAVATVIIDAGVAAPADAAPIALGADADPVRVKRGKRGKTRVAVKPPPRNMPRGLVSIVVETRPRGGTLYMADGAYGGADGTTLTRYGGKKVVVTCKMSGYTVGKTYLIFDGIADIALCHMKRIKKCLPGVKNPFDDCTDTDP